MTDAETLQQLYEEARRAMQTCSLTLAVRGPEPYMEKSAWVVYLLIYNYPNECFGTMSGPAHSFPEPVTGTWFVLKGPSNPQRVAPYQGREYEQYVRGEGDSLLAAAQDALERLRARLREEGNPDHPRQSHEGSL
jgi:hypothetical protein